MPVIDHEDTPLEEEIQQEVTGGRETLLVAEDDESVRNLATRVLQEAGYTVITASNGEEAIQALESNKDQINLVLLDVVMPKLGGIAVYQYFKFYFNAKLY